MVLLDVHQGLHAFEPFQPPSKFFPDGSIQFSRDCIVFSSKDKGEIVNK